jgi:hypothetical protein
MLGARTSPSALSAKREIILSYDLDEGTSTSRLSARRGRGRPRSQQKFVIPFKAHQWHRWHPFSYECILAKAILSDLFRIDNFDSVHTNRLVRKLSARDC